MESFPFFDYGKGRQHFLLSPLDYPPARTDGAVNGGRKPIHLPLTGSAGLANWCCTIKVDIENSKGQYIEKDKQEATKDGSESTKIQHGI